MFICVSCCTGFYEIKWTLRLKKLNILVHGNFKANSFVTSHNQYLNQEQEENVKNNKKNPETETGEACADIGSFKGGGQFS